MSDEPKVLPMPPREFAARRPDGYQSIEFEGLDEADNSSWHQRWDWVSIAKQTLVILVLVGCSLAIALGLVSMRSTSSEAQTTRHWDWCAAGGGAVDAGTCVTVDGNGQRWEIELSLKPYQPRQTLERDV